MISDRKWDSELLGLIAAIYKEAGKQEMYLKQRPEELEKLVEIAKVQSTEASNAIEGIVVTSTRVRQLVEGKTTPKNCDEQQIVGYRDALSIIHESFDAIPITQNYILQLHKILYSHMNNPAAGKTKMMQNYISATHPDGRTETIFTPLTPYETPDALDRLCEEYNRVIGNLELEPLIAIPVFIHDFLSIHPFNDGNGRMSRLLTTLLLYRSGFYVGKYISLEAKIAKNMEKHLLLQNTVNRGRRVRTKSVPDALTQRFHRCIYQIAGTGICDSGDHSITHVKRDQNACCFCSCNGLGDRRSDFSQHGICDDDPNRTYYYVGCSAGHNNSVFSGSPLICSRFEHCSCCNAIGSDSYDVL